MSENQTPSSPETGQDSSNEAKSADFEPLKIDKMDERGGKGAQKRGFQWFLFLLVLAALGASAYLGWMQYQMSADVLRANTFTLSQQKQEATNKALQEALESANKQLAENQKTIDELSTDLNLLKTRVAGISGVNRMDWLVDEVQHLTRLAHQRLVLSHDARGAIALLRAADKVVIEMRQTSALPIRQAIADDLLDLRLAAEVDLEGAYIRLDTLSKKLEELSFRKPDYPSRLALEEGELEAPNVPYSSESIENKMSGAASHILGKLQPYLYRSFRIDTEVKPLLNADEREYMARNMLMAIEEAQLALLRREPESYRLSLEQTEKWIKQYYDTNDPLTTSVLTIIEELKSYRLNPEMPEIDKTLEAVKVFAETWQEEKVSKPQLRRSLSQ